MTYGHAYPWQVAARAAGIPLSSRLRLSFDAASLRADVERALAAHAAKENHPGYHSGGWAGIGLVTANGEAQEIGAFAGEFKKTEAIAHTPYIEAMLDALPCEKQRVRIMELAPGADIFWHRDHELDHGVRRLHVPVITNPGVLMQICHEDCRWQPGELWFGDFAFPHRLRNTSRETRIHLVMDLVENEYVRGLFDPSFARSRRVLREPTRRLCGTLYAAYNAPNRVRHLVRERVIARA
jgi:hypothetical protein